jgi:hypothetical protein
VRSFLDRGRAAFLAGRVAQREALSRPTFENAVEWFVQQGALEPAEGGVRVAAQWRDGKLAELVAAIDRSLC